MAIKFEEESIDNIPEHFRELYSEQNGKFVLTGVEGVKSKADIDRIHASLVKERNDHKSTREKFQFLADRDLAQVQEMLDRFPELELAAQNKLDETGVQKLVEARLNTVTAPLKRDLDAYKRQNEEKDSLLAQFAAKERSRTINDNVREAISKMKGFRQEAIDDAILYAERMLELTEDNQVVTKVGVGVTPGVDPYVWLLDMQSKKPHWWGNTEGGGAGGSQSSGGPTANPWTAEGWNLTQQMLIYKKDPSRAQSLAKAAGSSIGGQPPAKK